MKISDELFESFLIQTHKQEDWTNEASATYIYIKDGTSYNLLTHGDPYQILPELAYEVKHREKTGMLLMYGWMTRIADENGDEIDEDHEPEERKRVRVMLYVQPKTEPILAVQAQGETVNIMDGMGEGMFPELFQTLMND